ncbi:hypothetical protein QFC22_004855 [Naganishia vaughanmartiniae]|uniref:Uncharacterized protein n=1 Tax=Naganishia vaughanmartiniae TaxID=1424756 RepID=A0ACC2WY38_9TREE|nr:hypothetical protein QFC22_004855 [Naganishia vaughanmartiniae]
MFHHLPSLRTGLVTALLLLGPTLGHILPRQYDASAPATVEPTSTFSISVSSTPINAPTVTYSSNVTTTAAPSAATASAYSLPTKYYKLVFTKGWVDTNGNPREAILINGQTPGPLIEAEEGQELTIEVVNQLDKPCTLHSHGIFQSFTPWADGVPGVTQYPIDPGATYTYTYTPLQYGQYWYHSHYRGQLDDGLRGPLLIHPSPSRAKPFATLSSDVDELEQMAKAERNPKIVQLSDWSQLTHDEIDADYHQTGIEPLCVDSFLINGRGQRICPPVALMEAVAPPTVIPLTNKGCVFPNSTVIMGPFPNYTAQYPDQANPLTFFGCENTTSPLTVIEVNKKDGYAAINVIHIGGLVEQKIAIDGHKFIVFANDGQYVEPQEVDILIVPVGARFQALVKLDNPGDWTIRTANSMPNQMISAYAVFSYVDKETCSPPANGLPELCGCKTFTSPPTNQPSFDYGGNVLNNATSVNYFTLKPFPAIAPPPQADHTLIWDVGKPIQRVWSLNLDGNPFLAWREQETPAIINPQPFLDANVAVALTYGEVIDVVFRIPAGNPTHPFHKHDAKAFIIGEGPGEFTWSSVAEAQLAVPQFFNLETPALRDTFGTIPAFASPTWLAIRWKVDSSMPVFFHCHISYHLAAGMATAFFEGLERGFPTGPPGTVQQGSTPVYYNNPNNTYPDGASIDA